MTEPNDIAFLARPAVFEYSKRLRRIHTTVPNFRLQPAFPGRVGWIVTEFETRGWVKYDGRRYSGDVR